MAIDLDSLLLSYRDYYGTYHHRKEQMAYGATVLYLGASSAVILKGSAIWSCDVPKPVLIILFIAAFAASALFVVWQLRNRELAADIVLACTILIKMRMADPNTTLSTEQDKYKGLDLPRFLADRLRHINAERRLLGGPRVSEAITYIAIVLWSVLGIISIV